ncbi:DUF6240 domain-containing protein [Anaerocolumna sp. AGMB13020]|uniref:DUF6240 domain-containing protein n=1 Tax=Anaerocolumna sp. AGMB13020 TaxID=3081750 RepID=UPI00295327C0|nr:DUF6240 domain-containing protein [Anaerocolumna sp. AGMB13020]WOO34536.1 DUF6240 domain-containing protein [Anaerocolumna sp. AGMB13020]
MNINVISEYKTTGAAGTADTSVPLQDVKKDEVKGTNEVQAQSAVAVYTEGSEKSSPVYEEKQEEAAEDTVYKQEESAGGDVSKTSSQITESDYIALEQEGISLEKFELERLDRMLARIKQQRELQENSLVDQRAKLTEKILQQQYLGLDYSKNKHLIERLDSANIPVTKANLDRISTGTDKARSVENMSDQAKYYLIKNRMEPTLDNIYKASYSAAHVKETPVNDSQWEEIKPQAAKIIEDSGFEVNEQSLSNARWLYSHNLGITENNLWATWDLDKIKSDMTTDKITDKLITSLAWGNTNSPSLSFLAEGQGYRAARADLDISDDTIRTMVSVRSDKEVDNLSIRDLYKQQRQQITDDRNIDNNTKAHIENTAQTAVSQEEIDIRTITVRRRLEEIRLKMTSDASGELLKKGFHLETDSLVKVVEGLKEIEDNYYRNLLKEGNVNVSQDNISTVKASLLQVEELKSAPAALLSNTLLSWSQETMESLTAAGNDYKRNHAADSYETLMTKPRADMGDSISKAFQNTGSLLEELGLEATEANKRALRILGYNNMPLTAENIDLVKLHDTQVNNVMKNFHPAVAVEFIRKGINPVELPVEELNNQINAMKEELGVTEEERFSRFLWKLDKNKEITEDERKSFIGLYRLLGAVDKTDGAALGAVVKANQELTLKNLLTAVRTRRGGGIETSVDDNFGTLSNYTKKGESITDQINTAYFEETSTSSEYTKAAYGKELVREIKDNLSPEALSGLGNTKDVADMTLEQVAEALNEQNKDTDKAYYNEKLKDFKEAVTKEAQVLLDNNKLPVTLSNVMAANDYLQKENTAFHKLNNLLQRSDSQREAADAIEEHVTLEVAEGTENSLNLEGISDKLLDNLESDSQIKNAYQEIETEVQDILKSYYEKGNLTVKDMEDIRRIGNGMQFITQMALRESYQIPLVTIEGITNVNVTLLKNTGDTGKAAIKIPTGKLGQIELNLTVKNNEVSAFIVCETREGLEAVKKKEAEIAEAFTIKDTKIKQISYGIGNNFGESGRYNNYKPKEEGDINTGDTPADTGTLLKLSKAFILQVKEIDNQL